jgi:hypothetical protein
MQMYVNKKNWYYTGQIHLTSTVYFFQLSAIPKPILQIELQNGKFGWAANMANAKLEWQSSQYKSHHEDCRFVFLSSVIIDFTCI